MGIFPHIFFSFTHSQDILIDLINDYWLWFLSSSLPMKNQENRMVASFKGRSMCTLCDDTFIPFMTGAFFFDWNLINGKSIFCIDKTLHWLKKKKSKCPCYFFYFSEISLRVLFFVFVYLSVLFHTYMSTHCWNILYIRTGENSGSEWRTCWTVTVKFAS